MSNDEDGTTRVERLDDPALKMKKTPVKGRASETKPSKKSEDLVAAKVELTLQKARSERCKQALTVAKTGALLFSTFPGLLGLQYIFLHMKPFRFGSPSGMAELPKPHLPPKPPKPEPSGHSSGARPVKRVDLSSVVPVPKRDSIKRSKGPSGNKVSGNAQKAPGPEVYAKTKVDASKSGIFVGDPTKAGGPYVTIPVWSQESEIIDNLSSVGRFIRRNTKSGAGQAKALSSLHEALSYLDGQSAKGGTFGSGAAMSATVPTAYMFPLGSGVQTIGRPDSVVVGLSRAHGASDAPHDSVDQGFFPILCSTFVVLAFILVCLLLKVRLWFLDRRVSIIEETVKQVQ